MCARGMQGYGQNTCVYCVVSTPDGYLTTVSRLVVDAALGEIITTCAKMDWLLNHGEKYLRPETRSSPLMLKYKKGQVLYEPLGVVAAIVSWNYRTSRSSG